MSAPEIAPARQRLLDLKASMPVRDALAQAMFAAWVNVPIEKLPGEYKQFDNPETMAAWGRVADAAAQVFLAPSEQAEYIKQLEQRVVFTERWADNRTKALDVAQKALIPFAAAYYNDNGDVTIDTGHIKSTDYRAAVKALESKVEELLVLYAQTPSETS